MRIENYDALWLLWALPLIVVVVGYGLYRRRCGLRVFAEAGLLGGINPNGSLLRLAMKAAVLLLAGCAIIVALTRPSWDERSEKVTRKGRDVVVLLDVSRSMLSEDMKPNRLEQAKLAIGDLLDAMRGDRIGIIAFAGVSVVKCPLTHDYGFARMVLSEIDTDSVSKGGTLIGDAIRKATDEVFDQQDRDFKDIVLITDGEDQDSYALEAAANAAARNIRIFAVGLGDEEEGARIPIRNDGSRVFLKHEGSEKWSRLNSKLLRDIVLATGGQYLPVRTGVSDLADVYRRLILPAGKKEMESSTVTRYDEKFQIFLALALALVVIEVMISERKKN